MPCRCDGYEVTADDVRREMRERVEHLQGQLCNAQSLIHKLLKHIDNPAEYGVTRALPQDLRARADAHIKALLDHKKAEHHEDVAQAQRQLKYAEQQLRQYKDSVAANHTKAVAQETEVERLKTQIAGMSKATDDEILG